MQITDVVGTIIQRVTGRLLRRALGGLLLALFFLGALYHLTVAGTLALELQFGALNARLIIGAAYALAAVITFAALWATRAKLKPRGDRAGLLNSTRDLQIAMIIEAVLLGFSLSKTSLGRKTPASRQPAE
jgi:hypothetical protein